TRLRFAPPQHVVAPYDALSMVWCRRRPGGGFPRGRRRRGDPTPHPLVAARRAGGGRTRRRRHCSRCGRRFTTYERIEDVVLVLIKRDGSREPWDRDKLEAGIRKALTGRPVTNPQIDQMLDRIEARVRKKGPEVPSSAVGAATLGAM